MVSKRLKDPVLTRACRRCLKQRPTRGMRMKYSFYHRAWGWLCLPCYAQSQSEHLSWKHKMEAML